MAYLMECVVGTLAAVGLICILKTVYDIIMTDYYSAVGRAELFLYGRGADPDSERLLCAAEQARRLYLPGLAITFVETGEPDGAYNFAEMISARRGMQYTKQSKD